MTTDQPDVEAPPSVESHRRIVRLLFACYVIPLLAAVGFFARYVATHHGVSLCASLACLFMAWCVTAHLDEARVYLRALKATEAHREVAS